MSDLKRPNPFAYSQPARLDRPKKAAIKPPLRDYHRAIEQMPPWARRVEEAPPQRVEDQAVEQAAPVAPAPVAPQLEDALAPLVAAPVAFDQAEQALARLALDVMEREDRVRFDEIDPFAGFPPLQAAPAPIAPAPKRPSLKSFVATDVEFEASDWSYERTIAAISDEGWRARDVEETIKEGDLFDYLDDPATNLHRIERVSGRKDTLVTTEDIETHGFVFYTLEGGGKKAVPHGKTTADYASIYKVPKHIGLKLPTDEAEAQRFFGCDVIGHDQYEKGKVTKCFYPILPTLRHKAFRAAFSRVFSDFARRYIRDNIKGLIPGRGDGIRLKRFISTKRLIKGAQTSDDYCVKTVLADLEKQLKVETDPVKLKTLRARYAAYQNVSEQTIESLLSRQDYRPKGARVEGRTIPFLKRMEARSLIPTDFGYDKAIGIEIETLCPLDLSEEQNAQVAREMNRDQGMATRVLTSHILSPAFIKQHGGLRCPSFMRPAMDGSIKDKEGGSTSNGGKNREWGVEWRILIKRSEMETRTLNALAYIDNLKCHVNKTCGLHIHFDMRDKEGKAPATARGGGAPYEPRDDIPAEVLKLHDRLVKWLAVLIELVPVARRESKYCKLENPEQAHWAGVSLDAYRKHKTLEVRLHSATTDHIKIIQWIRLLEMIMTMTFTPIPKTSTLDALKMLPLSEADRTYWLKRHQQLNPALYRNANGNPRTIKPDLGFLARPNEIE